MRDSKKGLSIVNYQLLILFLCLFSFVASVRAQVSHGGTPHFLYSGERNGLRSAIAEEPFFIEMPSFDLQALLEEDSINSSNMRRSIRFANKFFTAIERGKSGQNFVLPDGTKIWQVGLRSAGAYSINVLFSEFHIPEGGQLFLYSADKSHIIGSFTHENNTDGKMLPTAPVTGDEIIVEYSEPANVSFEGILKITEVNHDYRGILRAQPCNNNSTEYSCMTDILCSDVRDSEIKNSVVLLIINGNILCSGALINNTSNDETPYLLTGMHCFNKETPIHYPFDHYQNLAGTIVTFFNYNRPVCGSTMRGIEEMSVSGTYARCIIEPLDIALLELKETPPDYYRAYYAGWNIDPGGGTNPYSNIHHPYGDLKRYGMYNNKINLATLSGFSLFRANSFWLVKGWTSGSTYGGSSGSPLFDQNNYIVGALTGGSSICTTNPLKKGEDYFSALYLGWQFNSDSLQLKKWLDRDNTGLSQCPGFDPNEQDPFIRMSNADYLDGEGLATTKTTSGSYLFGSRSETAMEYAEAFEVDRTAEIFGAYMLNPAMTYPSGVNINIYTAVNNKPGEKVFSTYFHPQYTNYSGGSFSQVDKTTKSQPSESFIRFTDTPKVKGKFFVGYEVPSNSSFLVYNTLFDTGMTSTAWIKDPQNGWISASADPSLTSGTALAIQPLIKYTSDSADFMPETLHAPYLKYDRQQRILTVACQEGDTGVIKIYSITGQIIQQFSYSASGSFYLSSSLKNTMGIVHLESGNMVETLKVIF